MVWTFGGIICVLFSLNAICYISIIKCDFLFYHYQEEKDKKRKAHEEERRLMWIYNCNKAAVLSRCVFFFWTISQGDNSIFLFRSKERKSREPEREPIKEHEKGDRRDNDYRNRDRDRHYDRNRGNDRERVRERDNARSHDSRSHRRSRSRSRERSRDYDRHRSHFWALHILSLVCHVYQLLQTFLNIMWVSSCQA